VCYYLFEYVPERASLLGECTIIIYGSLLFMLSVGCYTRPVSSKAIFPLINDLHVIRNACGDIDKSFIILV
jgi:hypothetical protein